MVNTFPGLRFGNDKNPLTLASFLAAVDVCLMFENTLAIYLALQDLGSTVKKYVFLLLFQTQLIFYLSPIITSLYSLSTSVYFISISHYIFVPAINSERFVREVEKFLIFQQNTSFD